MCILQTVLTYHIQWINKKTFLKTIINKTHTIIYRLLFEQWTVSFLNIHTDLGLILNRIRGENKQYFIILLFNIKMHTMPFKLFLREPWYKMDKKELRERMGTNHHYHPEMNPHAEPKPHWWNKKISQPLQVTTVSGLGKNMITGVICKSST